MRLIIICLLLALAGCGAPASAPAPSAASPAPAPTAPPASAAPADWQRSWLRGEPCAPPCFLGITPGTTTQTQTLELLRASYPAVEPAEIHSGASEPSRISWLWDTADQSAGVTVFFYEQPPLYGTAPINTIIGIVTSGPDMGRLDEVIEVFGEPSHVLALAHDYGGIGIHYFLSVVYLDRGVMLTLSVSERKPAFAAGQQIIEIHFFTPTIEGFDAGISSDAPVRIPSALLTPWDGFKAFDDYCRESRTDPARKGCD